MKKLAVILISLAVLVGRADARDVVRRAGVQDFKYQVGDFYRKSRLTLGDSVRLDGITPINALSRGIDSYGLVACSDSLNALIVEVGEAGGGDIYLPPGYYRAKEPITIEYDNVRLIGSGGKSTIIFPTWDGADDADFHNTLRILHSNNVTISHIGVKGARCTGTCENSGIAIEGGRNNTIAYCWADSCDNAGILVGYDLYAFFDVPAAERYLPGNAAIDSIDGGGHIITGNIVTNTTDGSGIEVIRSDSCVVSQNVIYGSSSGYCVRNAASAGTLISNNVMYGSSGEMISVQGSGDLVASVHTGVVKKPDGCIIDGNIMYGTYGIRMFNGATDIVVSNNLIDCDSTGVGINLDKPRQRGTYSTLDYSWQNVLITGNTIVNSSIAFLCQGQGNGLVIRDNSIGEFISAALYFNSKSATDSSMVISGVNIGGNRIWVKNADMSGGSKYGFYVTGDSTYVNLDRNQYDMPYAAANQFAFMYGPYPKARQYYKYVKIAPHHITDFGVYGTGSTSEIASFNNAMSSLYNMSGADSTAPYNRGIDLYFPAGDYPTASINTMLEPVRAVGPGVPRLLTGGMPRQLSGFRTPLNEVAAPVGSLYFRAGDADSILFLKTSAGLGGWVLK